MNKKTIITIAIVVLSALFFLIFYFLLFKKSSNTIKTYGNIEIRQVDLSFQVAGIIKEIFVEEGDFVKKGDLLATLDDRDYQANLKRTVFQKDSSLAQSKEDKQKFDKNHPLCLDGTLSKLECDSLENSKNLSLARYNQNQAEVEFQRLQLEYTKMYAPQDGIITTRVQEKGARVEKNQIVFIESLNNPIWTRTYIKEQDLGNIKYGQKALVLTDTKDPTTGKNKQYQGTIGYISPVAEFTPKTVQTEDLRADLVYRIRVYIDEVDSFLRQGMPVSVEIKLGENDGVR